MNQKKSNAALENLIKSLNQVKLDTATETSTNHNEVSTTDNQTSAFDSDSDDWY